MSVDNPRDVPDQFREHFERREIDPFTYRALHRKVKGVGLNSVVRALSGEGRLTPRVSKAVADALGITPEKLLELRGDPVTVPFQLPARASQLNQRERDAVLGVVHALLDARDRYDSDTNSDTPTEEQGASSEAGEDQKTAGTGGLTRGKKPTGGYLAGKMSEQDELKRRRKSKGRDFGADPIIEQDEAAFTGDDQPTDYQRNAGPPADAIDPPPGDDDIS